jgi:dihydroneopterin aldolase
LGGFALGKVALLGLEFYGKHGRYPEENRLGARFVVDLELMVAFEGRPDSLEATVDYGAVYALVQELVTQKSYYLIESLAEALALGILAEFAAVDSLLVRVHKPHAPLPGVFRDVYVETSRSR